MARDPKQIAVIMMQLRRKGAIKSLGGLRATINKLREAGHRASDYRTLYHVTKQEHVPSILNEGLKPFEASFDPGKYVYTGNRKTVERFKAWDEYNAKPWEKTREGRQRIVLKARVPKTKIETRVDTSGLTIPNKWKPWKEYRIPDVIEPSTIRESLVRENRVEALKRVLKKHEEYAKIRRQRAAILWSRRNFRKNPVFKEMVDRGLIMNPMESQLPKKVRKL